MYSSKYRNYIYGEEKYPQHINKKLYVNTPLDSYHHIYKNKYNNTRPEVIHNKNIYYDNIGMSNNEQCFHNKYSNNFINNNNNIEYKNNLKYIKKRYNSRNNSYNNKHGIHVYPSRIEKCHKDYLNPIRGDKKKNRYTLHIGNNKNSFELPSKYEGIYNNHHRFQKNMDEKNKDIKCISIKTVINKPNVKKIPCINYDTQNYHIKLGWWNFGNPLKLFSKIERYKQNIKEKYYENRKYCKNISSINSFNKYSNKYLCNEYFYIPITDKNYFKNKSLLNKNNKSYPVSDFQKVNLKPITGFIQSYKKEKEKKKKNRQHAIIKISNVPYIINDYKKNLNKHKHIENIKTLNLKEMNFDMPKNINDIPNLHNTCGLIATISNKYDEQNNSKGVIITCQQRNKNNNIKKKKKNFYMDHNNNENTIKDNNQVNIKFNNNTFDRYKKNGNINHNTSNFIRSVKKHRKKKKKKNDRNINLINVKKYKICSSNSEGSRKYHITSESIKSNGSLHNKHKKEQLYDTYKEKINNKYMIKEPIKRYRMKIKTHKKNYSNEKNANYNENRKSSNESSYYDKKYVMKYKEIKQNTKKNKSYSISSLSSQVSLNKQKRNKTYHVKNIHHKIKGTNYQKYNKYHEYGTYNKNHNTLKIYKNKNDGQKKLKDHSDHNIEKIYANNSDNNTYTNSLYKSNYINKENAYDNKQKEVHQKVPSKIYDENYSCQKDDKYNSYKLKGYEYNYKNVENNKPNSKIYRYNKLKNNKINESDMLEKEYDEYFHDKY
ncbi:hypothetical protein PGSY75_1141000 [Plasmodium gaboni]|uniref:Uncharacterized protein n=1 Tax=Plasmodium gaboni TaxID=647221 RepID=A0A151LJ70_9APIC|nr:hypothetical protein PGSY75_1141000 [Plasmodium gaboni]KYN99045.1 hypothetical protein PGSY75_1141000 [Plasmodium gaboni]